MMKISGADCVKMEVGIEHVDLIRELAGIGVAVIAHLGLRPQAIGLMGGYKVRGRTAEEARTLVSLALEMQRAGAAAVLLEAVPPEVAERIVQATTVPIIGCGAGPACHAHVIVTQDGLGLTTHKPRFVPDLGDLSAPMKEMFARYVNQIGSGAYPSPQHNYEMAGDERTRFLDDRA
jgi:3-methyl-2-oxobutanoate hydroxymethyltransferase